MHVGVTGMDDDPRQFQFIAPDVPQHIYMLTHAAAVASCGVWGDTVDATPHALHALTTAY